MDNFTRESLHSSIGWSFLDTKYQGTVRKMRLEPKLMETELLYLDLDSDTRRQFKRWQTGFLWMESLTDLGIYYREGRVILWLFSWKFGPSMVTCCKWLGFNLGWQQILVLHPSMTFSQPYHSQKSRRLLSLLSMSMQLSHSMLMNFQCFILKLDLTVGG